MLSIELTGRRALITGSRSGLGEAMAHALAQAGAQIAVHDRDKSAACENVAAALRASGAQAQAFGGDISKPDQIEALFADIHACAAASTFSSTMRGWMARGPTASSAIWPAILRAPASPSTAAC